MNNPDYEPGDLVFLPQNTMIVAFDANKLSYLDKPEIGLLIKDIDERENKVFLFGSVTGYFNTIGKIYKYDGAKL